MTPLATAGTAEYRTRNVEGRRRKSPRKGARRHEKPGSTDFDLASLPSLNILNFRVLRGYLIRQLVPFLLRHSLFDIHLFSVGRQILARKTSFHAFVERAHLVFRSILLKLVLCICLVMRLFKKRTKCINVLRKLGDGIWRSGLGSPKEWKDA